MIMPGAQVVEGTYDGVVVVGDHAGLHQADAVIGEPAGEVVHVRIARPAREDFIADHKHGCGGIGHGDSF